MKDGLSKAREGFFFSSEGVCVLFFFPSPLLPLLGREGCGVRALFHSFLFDLVWSIRRGKDVW